MSKKKKIIIWSIVLLLIAAAIGTYIYFATKKPAVEYTTAPVEKGSVAQTVSVTGSIVDNEEVTLNFEIGGRITNVTAEEGAFVSQGETIATLDSANLSSELDQAKAAWNKAAADAAANDDTINQAKVDVANAKEYLEDTEDYYQKKVNEAGQEVKNTEDYYEDAQDYYNEEKTTTRKLTLTTAENNLKAARKAKESAEEMADLYHTAAKNSLNAARAKLETLESKYAQQSLDATVTSARAGYEIALNNLGKTSLKSPVNGTITEINNKKGEVLGTGTIKESFAKMISGDLLIESRVPESDIMKLKTNMKADFTLDALPSEEKFSAEVIEISPAGTVSQDVVSYKVKFRLNENDSRFKPGMTANLDIKIGRASCRERV